MGVNRISLGVQSWDDELLKLLGREHNAAQAEASFQIFRDAGFTNVSIDLMFGLPGQSLAQWEADLEKTIRLQPDHISTYCLTYEEDTEFFLRHTRGEFREDPESDARFLETAMQTARSRRLRALRNLKLRPPRLRLGPQPRLLGRPRLSRHRSQRVFHCRPRRAGKTSATTAPTPTALLAGSSPIASTEILTPEMKRAERSPSHSGQETAFHPRSSRNGQPKAESSSILACSAKSGGNFVLTPRGKLLADSVAEAFV